MFAANPISNPVIPSFNTIIAYPIKPVYSIAVLSTKPYTRSATKKKNLSLPARAHFLFQKKVQYRQNRICEPILISVFQN